MKKENKKVNNEHGQAQAFLSVSGMTFEQFTEKAQWLLEDENWKATGHKTIKEFLETFDFSRFKLDKELRRELVEGMTKNGASQRQIAGALGVGVGTVNRDLDNVPDGTEEPENEPKNEDYDSSSVPDGTPPDDPKPEEGVEQVEAEVVEPEREDDGLVFHEMSITGDPVIEAIQVCLKKSLEIKNHKKYVEWVRVFLNQYLTKFYRNEAS